MSKIKIFLFVVFLLFMSFHVKAFADDLNIAFTIDKKYPIYTLLTINSILQNNKSASNYIFWVIENDLTDKDKKMMRNYVKKHKQDINFINISLDKIDNGKNLYADSIFSSHVSRIGAARILLPDVLPDNIHKALYLDSDILVLSDIKELYDTDITGYGAAMAENSSEFLKREKDKKNIYCNSGVILINLDYWREVQATEKMIEFIQKNNLQSPEQDAINKILYGKIKVLNQKWNNQTRELSNAIVPVNDGGIIHYLGGIKPWNVFPDTSKEVQLYYDYWKKSGIKQRR